MLRGSQFYSDDPDHPLPVAERILRWYWPPTVPFVMPEGFHKAQTYARVNHGRWVADCPFCSSAVVADPEDPRFFCVHCLNNGTGKWVRVVWPEDFAAIEAELALRARTTHRNWDPQESLADLRDERQGRTQLGRDVVAALERQGGLPVLDARSGDVTLLEGRDARAALEEGGSR